MWLIRSCLSQDIKYLAQHETSAKHLWETLEKKYLTKSVESRLQLKSKLYQFQMKKGSSVNEHINRYTKLLTDLVNVDVKVDEEDKAIILLNSLPAEEYETFTLTLSLVDRLWIIMRCRLHWQVMRRGERRGILLSQAHRRRHWQ